MYIHVRTCVHRTIYLCIHMSNIKQHQVYIKQRIFKELSLLGYYSVQSGESEPTFRRNISSPSSGSKSKPINKPI
jgi:hypothetical protein